MTDRARSGEVIRFRVRACAAASGEVSRGLFRARLGIPDLLLSRIPRGLFVPLAPLRRALTIGLFLRVGLGFFAPSFCLGLGGLILGSESFFDLQPRLLARQ